MSRILINILCFSMIGISSIVYPQLNNKENNIIVGENFRIYPSIANQTETFIVNHPINQSILFASAYTLVPPFFISEGVYVSTNSGSSWRGTDTCYGIPIQFHGGEPGIAIDKNGTFIINRLGRQPNFPGLYSHFSTDNGLTWSNQFTITSEDLEKHSIVSNTTSGSNFDGRTYAAYTLITPPYNVKFTYSDNGGSWSALKTVNNPPIRCYGTDMDVNLSGDVFICWAVIQPTALEISIGFARSIDGGTNWTVQENPIQTRGLTGLLPEKSNIRVNSIPQIAVDKSSSAHQNNIYIVTSQKLLAPAGSDPDIVLFKSTNNGANWSSGIRVNQDPINNGKIQFFPSIHIDPSGGINVLYFDDRNTTSDSSGVFLSRSTDGGSSWSDYQISDHNHKPGSVSGIGAANSPDHLDLTYSNGKLWTVWMDNSTGIYQVWAAEVGLDSTVEQIVAPSNLSADADTFFVNLIWDDNSDNESGFIISRGDGKISSNPAFYNIDTVFTDVNNYVDGNVQPNSTYTYRVYAFNQDAVSEFSNSVDVTTLPITTDQDSPFVLEQNYPNPFTNETTITIKIPRLTNVTLKIYDVLGNEIRTILNEVKRAGVYFINFNNVNNLSSGLYFYQLSADNFSKTKPMILLK